MTMGDCIPHPGRLHKFEGDNVVSNGHGMTCRPCRDVKHREWKRANQAAYRARMKVSV